MNNFFDDIVEFHQKFDLTYTGKPRALPETMADFRHAFMLEEADEWVDENVLAKDAELRADKVDYISHLENQLDAIIDELYVVLGTAYLQGFTKEILTEAWRRVHEKNMQKVRATRNEDSKRESTLDVVKPKGWEPPSHRDLVEDCEYEG